MKILIFDTLISGHHLEYIHHLYSINDTTHTYIYAIPEEFENIRDKFKWEIKKNVIFDYIDGNLISNINRKGHLVKSYYLSKLLKSYITKHLADKVFLISMIDYYPCMPFIIGRKIEVAGIIYKIYLYEWKNYNVKQKLYEAIRQILLVTGSNVIFLLNDNSATCYLNAKWKTNKFKDLIDPYIAFKLEDLWDIRSKYNIDYKKKIFAHLGSMSDRKGTLEILKAIEYIHNKNQCVFIFAGKIGDDIKTEFYDLINIYRDKIQIIVIDEFCNYSLIGSIIRSCDCLLLPYKRTSLSSGFIYYALQFKKNVISTNDGLLGKLVRKYKLGYLIKKTSPQLIAKAINDFAYKEIPNMDMQDFSYEKFNETIYYGFIKD